MELEKHETEVFEDKPIEQEKQIDETEEELLVIVGQSYNEAYQYVKDEHKDKSDYFCKGVALFLVIQKLNENDGDVYKLPSYFDK